jgi:hypothetical protein
LKYCNRPERIIRKTSYIIATMEVHRMKITLVKKSGGVGRLSARNVSEEEAVWFCHTAVNNGLWMACWTNEKGVRLVTVSGRWEEIEGLYGEAEKRGSE